MAMSNGQHDSIRQGLRVRRRMRRLKIVLPLVALVLFFALVASYRSQNFGQSGFNLPAELPTNMQNMVVEGRSDAGTPYRVSVARAEVRGDDERLLYLTAFKSDLQQSPQALTIEAPNGVLDREQNLFDLNRPVRIRRADGLMMDAGQSVFDIDGAQMRSQDGVLITGPGGRTLSAEAFSINAEAGQHAFSGKVRVYIPPRAR